MLIPIEYRLQCDNGAACHDSQGITRDGACVVVGAWSVFLANTKTAARRKATAAGWVRVKLGTCGPMVDLCPECAAGREVSS